MNFASQFGEFLDNDENWNVDRKQFIRAINDPVNFAEIIMQCMFKRLDIGLDLVAEVPNVAMEYSKTLPFDFPDGDAWYILLRGMARGGIHDTELMPLVEQCLSSPYSGTRDAAVFCLGDLCENGSQMALDRLRQLVDDPDPYIKETATEILDDVETNG